MARPALLAMLSSVVLVGGSVSHPPQASAPSAVPVAANIGNSTQLFVDDFLVANSSGLTRSMHSPDCSRAVVTADAPWEHNFTVGMIGTSVLMDGGKLRVWYSLRNSTLGCRPANIPASKNDQPPCSAHDPPQPNYEASAGKIYIGYAESTDGGKTFTKPLMHKYSVRGSTANNFVAIASPGSNGLAIFIDPAEPQGSPHRYRGVSANLAMTSPDGLNWTTIGTYDPPASIPGGPSGVNNGSGAFDTQGVMFFDPKCECYSFYTRWDRFDQNHGGPKGAEGGRAVRRARSTRLQVTNSTVRGSTVRHIGSWVNQSVVMGADALDTSTHTYGVMDGGPVDYYGATPWYVDHGEGFGWYFMAAVRFWHWGPPGPDQPVTGTKDLVLAASRDGENFSFVEHAPWLSPGLDGSVGSRQLWLAPPGPLRVGDEELYFVTKANVDEYSGLSIDPKSPHGEWEAEIAVGKLRLNGLVSLDAGYTSSANAAMLTTKPFIFAGRRLLLNLDASGGGSLFIQLHLAAEFPATPRSALLTSNYLVHNGVDLEVEFWNGGDAPGAVNSTAIASLAGTPVVMVMRMQDCRLYGLRFAP
jgi:hypothetical protein